MVFRYNLKLFILCLLSVAPRFAHPLLLRLSSEVNESLRQARSLWASLRFCASALGLSYPSRLFLYVSEKNIYVFFNIYFLKFVAFLRTDGEASRRGCRCGLAAATGAACWRRRRRGSFRRRGKPGPGRVRRLFRARGSRRCRVGARRAGRALVPAGSA